MKNGLMALAGALALGIGPAFADSTPAADPPLVVNGDLQLTTSDFIAYTKIIPEDNRTDFLTSLDKINRTVDGLWVRRMLAQKARSAGLADDPEIVARLRQAEDAILADRYFERVVNRGIVLPNLEKRALEIYKADPQRFTVGETLHVQQIVVGLQGRTRDEAAQRAREAYTQSTTGSKEFLVYARLYSDDPNLAKTGGDLGYKSPGSFTEGAWAQVSKMKAGDVGQPLETSQGFFIYRLVDRKPAKVHPFEEVKDKIIADEAQKLIDAKREDAIVAVRFDPKTVIHTDNIRKLQVKVDVNSLPKVEGKR